MSLSESNQAFDYPILTTLVSFISLCASFEGGPIHSLEMQCHETPHRKEVKSLAKVTQKMLAYMGIEPRQIPVLAV